MATEEKRSVGGFWWSISLSSCIFFFGVFLDMLMPGAIAIRNFKNYLVIYFVSEVALHISDFII